LSFCHTELGNASNQIVSTFEIFIEASPKSREFSARGRVHPDLFAEASIGHSSTQCLHSPQMVSSELSAAGCSPSIRAAFYMH